MMRDLRAVLALTLMLLWSAATSTLAQVSAAGSTLHGVVPGCRGDLNLDGQRGPGDVALLSAHLSGQEILEGQALANADVNFDFVVDVADTVRLLQHNTGEFLLLPCGDFVPLEITCPDLALDQASALPLQRVGLGSLPEEFAEAVVAVVTEENDEVGVMSFLERLEDDTFTLLTPFYPGPGLGGGAVKVQVTDGLVTCPLLDFSIQAIPPAPGEASRVVDALQDFVLVQAAGMGLTSDDLMGGGELPAPAIPLLVAQRLLDHPDNPDSLRAIAQGTAPFLEGAADGTVLDGILGHLQVAGLVGQGEHAAAPAGFSLPIDDLLGCGESAENLDNCMRKAAEAERILNPPDDGPAVKELKEDAALTLAALKVFPVTRNLVNIGEEAVENLKKGFNQATPVLGLALAIRKWAAEAGAGLLPSSFVSLHTNLFPAAMEEDLDSGEWSSLLIATSKGWKLDGRRVLQYAFEELKASDLLEKQVSKGVGKAFEWAGDLPHVDDEELQEKLVELITEQVSEIAPDALKGVTVFEIEPELFGPVEIGEEQWSKVEFQGVAVEKLGHNQYRPRKADDDGADIIVRVRTDEDRFGGVPSIKAAPAHVEVKPIGLHIEPDVKVLEPDEKIVFFTVSVQNSAYPEKVEVEAETGETEREYLGENEHLVTYEAPDPLPQKFTDIVTAVHTAETGARRPGLNPPARTDQATIEGPPKKAQIILDPVADCVEPGSKEPLCFTAQVIGQENQMVSWSASGGDITSGGCFEAPGSPEIVFVTATSAADPTLKGQAVVKVGGCGCWWSLQVGGNTLVGTPGADYGTFFRNTGNGDVIVQMFNAEGDSFAVRNNTIEQIWEVGGTLGVTSPDVGWDTAGRQDLISGGKLSENSDTAVAGVVAGQAIVSSIVGNDSQERLEPFWIRFRIEDDPEHIGFFPGCVIPLEFQPGS